MNGLSVANYVQAYAYSGCLFVYCAWQFKELDKTLQIQAYTLTITSYQSHHKSNKKNKEQKCVKGIG